MAKSSTPSFFDLLEACQKPGCPVCRLVQRSVRRHLNYLFYESVNDIPIRAVLRANLGFCSSHAALLISGEVGNPLGVSIIYHDVMTNVLRNLPEPAADSASGWTRRFSRGLTERIKRAVSALTPKARCPACELRDTVTGMVIGMLAESISEGKLLNELQTSEGLCIPHLSLAIQHNTGAAIEPLLALHREKWSALDTELAEFIRKNDYRFENEPMGSERDAWRRVLSIGSGAPGAIGEE